MEKLKGIVTKLSLATHVSGTNDSTSTDHVATFLLDTTPVRLTLPQAALISEGDTVVVAGNKKRGVLEALAYRNFNTGAMGKGAVMNHYILGSIFALVGLATLFFFIGAVFLAIGLWSLHRARRLARAYSLVEGAA